MTAPTSKTTGSASRQRGAVLFISLIFLLVLTLLGVMLARSQTTEERMAQNDSNHDLAVEAAGAALRFAEDNLADANPAYADLAQDTGGLYQLDPTVGSIYTAALWNTAAVMTYNGAALTPTVPTAPQFLIEELPQVALPGTPLGGCTGYSGNGCVSVYQITARGSGGDLSGSATLRSIYEKD